MEGFLLSGFTDGETEAQGGSVTCPRSPREEGLKQNRNQPRGSGRRLLTMACAASLEDGFKAVRFLSTY